MFRRFFLVQGFCLLLVACGTPGVSLKYYEDLDRLLDSQRYQEAIQFAERQRKLYGEKSELLYLMDMAMLKTLAGDADEANALIDAAEELIESLYTKSLTREAASFLTSDASLPYEGEDFEKVFLNVLAAINYAMLGMPDEAAVEARRADVKLTEMARVRGGKTAYPEDGFVRFLMGLVYEDAGEINDAWVSYARAIEAYEKHGFGVEVPRTLLWRASVVAASLGFREELSALRKKFGQAIPQNPLQWKGLGRVVVVEFAGKVPTKVEQRLEITLGQGLVFVQGMTVTSQEEQQVSAALSAAKSLAAETNIVIAYPEMVAQPPASPPVTIHISSPTEAAFRVSAERVQNLVEIAPVCLKERMGRVWAKTIARAVVKYLIAYAAGKAGEAAGGKKHGWLTGFLARGITAATLQASEHADTRSWGTLPGEVRLAVLALSPGEYTLTIAGRPPEKVTVVQGRSIWRLIRTR